MIDRSENAFSFSERVVNDDVTNERSARAFASPRREIASRTERRSLDETSTTNAPERSRVDVDGCTTFFRLPPASRRDATAGLATT